MLAHVPTAAVDLHGLVRHPPGGLAADELHRGRHRVQLLAIRAAPAGLPADPVEHRLRGHELGRHVGEHELDRLEVDDRPSELTTILREVEGELERARGGADRSRADHQTFLDEPVLRQLDAPADPAEDPVVAHPDGLEREDRVLEHERVHVRRRPDEAHTGRVLVDEEERRLRRVAVHVGVEEEEVGDVARGHVPLLARRAPSRRRRGSRRRLDHRRVGAGASSVMA